MNLFLTRLACSLRADRSSARMVSNSSALWAAIACWQSSRILSSSRLVGTPAPKKILPTDRRPARYRTRCNFHGERGELDRSDRPLALSPCGQSIAINRRSRCGVRGWPVWSSHFCPGAAPQVGQWTSSESIRLGAFFMAWR